MKHYLYFTICLGFLFWGCEKDDDPKIKPAEVKQIDILDFSVPGIDKKNITVKENLIVVYLPENYPGGNYIKPDIIFQTGYFSRSELLNGVTFEGQEIRLEVESNTYERVNFDVIIIPHKAIQLDKPVRDYNLAIGPEATITTSFDLKGTRATVNDSGKIVYEPFIRLTDKATGQIEQELYADTSYPDAGNGPTFTLPPSILPGEYTAEIVWGTQTELLSSLVKVNPGPIQFKRGSWHMQGAHRYFEITAYNLSPTDKYEAIIQNDFVAAQRIPLKYEKPGTLSGNLPQSVGFGNYKITYLVNGKEQKPYEDRVWLDRYLGDDHFYIRKNGTQPILRIVTQLSLRSFFSTGQISQLPYYPSTDEIDRKEPILAYTQSWGPFPDHNEMILTNQETGTEYTLPYSGNFYGMFDFFASFLSYPIPDNVPNGKYAIRVVRGTEQTENYSRILTLK